MRSRFLSTDAVLLAMLACLSFATSLQADTATAEPTEKTQEATASDKNVEPSAEKKDVKVRLAHIKIEGELPESAGQMSFFGDLGHDLRKTIARLDKAANDKTVDGIILEIGSAALSRGKLNELREALLNIRKSGKKVFAQLESAEGPQYLLASACDEIIMPEAGVIVIPGVQLQIAYYKDLLGKLGVEADILHVGESKGAAEPLMRHNMSEPVRKNLTALVDDLYDQMLTTIAADRDLQIKEVKRIVNRGLLTANQAKTAGLIDRVEYYDEFRNELKQEYKADQLVYVINYGKQEIDTDFSGPMGMIKLFQSIMGGSSGSESSKGPKLALVYAVGGITSGKSESGFGSEVMGSETIVKALHEAAKDENVKAIVLRIDSPGGSALASDIIWRATQAIDKPIIASMGDVAASGGYYIAMGADKIIAEPGTITGSIGVVGGKLSLAGLFDKIGVSTDSINRGENSNIFSSTTKFSDGEREVVTGMMQDIYRLFTTKAAEGRKMDLDKLEALAGGQVYTGRIAKRNGLIDEVGTLKDAFQTAKTMAGLDPEKKYELLILPEPTNPLEELFGTDLDKERETHALSSLGQLVPELAGSLNHATQLRGLMQERAMLLMPFWINVQ